MGVTKGKEGPVSHSHNGGPRAAARWWRRQVPGEGRVWRSAGRERASSGRSQQGCGDRPSARVRAGSGVARLESRRASGAAAAGSGAADAPKRGTECGSWQSGRRDGAEGRVRGPPPLTEPWPGKDGQRGRRNVRPPRGPERRQLLAGGTGAERSG